MAKTFDGIDGPLGTWLRRQHVFFVATAPLAADGHVNLSPKGLDSFAVIDPHTVAYLDLTGSGVETIAHLGENGRICIMFCAFEGPPRIVRLHGRGRVAPAGTPEFAAFAHHFEPRRGTRSVIAVDLDRVSDSCGYAVPLMRYEGDRDRLGRWVEGRTDDELATYRAEKNASSIDGLDGLGVPEHAP